MTIHSLHHVNLGGPPALVREMHNFYCRVLGLRDGPRPPFSSKGVWLYAGDLAVVHLVEVEAGGPPTSGHHESAALNHVAFRCSGFDATCGHLDAFGVSYTVSDVPMSQEVQINLVDPSGLKVELSFDPAETREPGR